MTLTFPFLPGLRAPLFAPADDPAGGGGDGGDGGQGGDPAGGGTGGDGGQGGDPAGTGGAGAQGGGTGGEGGDDPYAWFGDNLDDEARAYLEAKKFDSPEKLYKSLRSAEKVLRNGERILPPPDDPAKIGEWMRESGLGERLGVPQDASGYQVEPPKFDDDVAPMVNYGEERHGQFLEKASELGMTESQAKGILEFYQGQMSHDVRSYNDAATADQTEMQAELRREWGNDFDENVTAALEVAREEGLDETAIESLRAGGVAGSAKLTKILHELAQVRGNDELKGGARGGQPQPTKEQAETELKSFAAENAKALNSRDHPEHDTAMSRYRELQRRAGRGSAALGA